MQRGFSTFLRPYFRFFLFNILLTLIVVPFLEGQSTVEYIVCYKQDSKPRKSQILQDQNVQNFKSIFKDLNLWSITIKNNKDKNKTLTMLRKEDGVRYLHESLIATNRQIPNDPDYPSQWSLPLIQMDEAWDITTGGKNPAGHDIVVAILDDGYQIDHPDLEGAIWINQNEIEDNGIDDDNNGFVDDYFGWNALEETDDHLVSSHGTSVAGIIGATTDNNNQMAGINWDVKLMLTSSGSQNGYSLPLIVKSYEYIYEQRKLYNESNGASGAYVVATNYSGGIEDRFPEDFPAWCEVYDALGSVGIINVGSTANNNKDVDVDGDLPSTCLSDFLIVTTNSGRVNQKVENAGFGSTSVDLAAPGDDIYTITRNSGIDQSFFGTSGSAPHIAGVISLLYAVICEESYVQSIEDPASMALITKNAILSEVTPSSDLAGITVTGGVLNALRSIEAIDESIGDCCIITVDEIIATAESCADADDGIFDIIASGKDLEGNLGYNLTGDGLELQNELGDFNRLPAQEYMLRVSDLMNPLCFTDTTISIQEVMEVCPFGEFAINELRHDNSAGRLVISYDLDEQKDIKVQIHDNLGRLMYDQLIRPTLNEGRTHELRTNDYPAGVYHASILANGQRDVASFLVVH